MAVLDGKQNQGIGATLMKTGFCLARDQAQKTGCAFVVVEVRAGLGGTRYWEPNVEFDSISPDPNRDGGVIVAEIKFRPLPQRERQAIDADLARRWAASTIARR